jgi:DNA primase
MDAVQEIKSRLDVADIVGEYLPLKPSGTGTFKANCPFHNERTPSFFVSRPRQSWHCFGCDEGGDIFSFVQRMEGFGFREALQHLAGKAGVTLPEFEHKPEYNSKQRLFEINDLARRFYRSTLETAQDAEIARAYVAKRGVDTLTADLFSLGYSPDEWSAFADYAKTKGITDTELIQAGLANKREKGSGVYDRFRGRLMFPIWDVQGHVIGFTARILTDAKDQPKYVNTPETPAYKKSAVLYGLDKAKGAIRQDDMAVIVEGNMDVVGSHQFNVQNVVASSGTALTGEQLFLIKRFTTNIAIAFDQDSAGVAATLRGLDLARSQDFSIRVITLPPEAGKDPDEAVRKDPQLWRDAIKNAIPIMEWVYRMGFKAGSPSTPEGKKEIVKMILPEIGRIADAVERDHWMRRLAKDLDTSLSALEEVLQKLGKAKIYGTPLPREEAPAEAPIEPMDPDRLWNEAQEERILAMCLYFKEDPKNILQECGWAEPVFGRPDLEKLYMALGTAYTQTRQETPSNIATGIRPPASLASDEATTFDALAFFAEREFQGQPLEQLKRELQRDAAALQDRLKKIKRRHLEQQMREAERLNDQERMTALLEQFQKLT